MSLFTYKLLKSLICKRNYAIYNKDNFKITLIGGAGSIGQSIAMILKLSPLISDINLYDIRPADGIALDISHICSTSKVNSFNGIEKLDEALNGCDIAVICSGRSITPSIDRNDLLSVNAALIKDLARPIVKNCPNALIALITDPVNSLLPLLNVSMAEAGNDRPERVFGVTTLDVVRSKSIIGKMLQKNPFDIDVQVIGGNSAETIIPVLSRTYPSLLLDESDLKLLTDRIKSAEMDVVKMNCGSSHLAMAFSGARFTLALCRAMKGDTDIVECAYVKSNVTEADYFATPILFGRDGVKKNLGLGELSKYELELVNETVRLLKNDIKRGLKYVN